jgi:hypothetical protein
MNNDLETRLAAWRQRTVSGGLGQLEPLVWARIDAQRSTPAFARRSSPQ